MTRPISASAQNPRDCHDQEANTLRRTCLAALRKFGVTKVTAKYAGYGGKGTIETVTFKPQPATFDDDLRRDVTSLMHKFASAANPGFEDDDGGFGEIHWRLDDDHIAVWHRACSYDEFEAEDEVA